MDIFLIHALILHEIPACSFGESEYIDTLIKGRNP